MMLRCFSHAGQTIAERRRAYFAGDKPAEALPSPPVKNEKDDMAKLKAENEDQSKKIDLLQRQLAAKERAQQLTGQSYYPVGSRAVPRGLQGNTLNRDPRIRAHMESQSASRNFRGLIDFLPQYHIQGGKVIAKPTPYGAVAYGLEDGAIRKRYDKEKGLLTFVMRNGQWEFQDVESTPEQMRAATVRLNQESDARAAAKANHERMQLTWMRRGLDGDYVPPAGEQAREYEVMQYYRGLANGTVRTDPNYNPNWTENYKVMGQYRGNGAAPNAAPNAVREQAGKRQNAVFGEAYEAKIRPHRANIIALHLRKNAPDGRFVSLPPGIAQWKEGASSLYRIDAKGTVQAYQKNDGIYRYDEAANKWLKYSEQEQGEIVKAWVTDTEGPSAAAPVMPQGQAQARSAYDAPAKARGVPPVTEAQRAVEQQKYNDAQKLPVNTWGKIDSAAYDSKDQTTQYMYRLLEDGTLQAYSPKTGLQQYDQQNRRWFFPGSKPTRYIQAEKEYAALFPKDAGSPPAVAPVETTVPPLNSAPSSPNQKPPAAPVITPEQSKIIADGATTLSNAIKKGAELYGVRIDAGTSTPQLESSVLAEQLGDQLSALRNKEDASTPKTPEKTVGSSPKTTVGTDELSPESQDKRLLLAQKFGITIEGRLTDKPIPNDQVLKLEAVLRTLHPDVLGALRGKEIYDGKSNTSSEEYIYVDLEQNEENIQSQLRQYLEKSNKLAAIRTQFDAIAKSHGIGELKVFWKDMDEVLGNIPKITEALDRVQPDTMEMLKNKTVVCGKKSYVNKDCLAIDVTGTPAEILEYIEKDAPYLDLIHKVEDLDKTTDMYVIFPFSPSDEVTKFDVSKEDQRRIVQNFGKFESVVQSFDSNTIGSGSIVPTAEQAYDIDVAWIDVTKDENSIREQITEFYRLQKLYDEKMGKKLIELGHKNMDIYLTVRLDQVDVLSEHFEKLEMVLSRLDTKAKEQLKDQRVEIFLGSSNHGEGERNVYIDVTKTEDEILQQFSDYLHSRTQDKEKVKMTEQK